MYCTSVICAQKKNGKPPASVLPVDSVLPERIHLSERMSTSVVLCLLTLILSSLVGPGRADNQPSTKRPGAVRRDGRARAAKKIEAASKVLSPAGDVGGGGQLGSGAEYLEQTETEWDGKTPWFTGSCKWKCGVRIPAFSGTARYYRMLRIYEILRLQTTLFAFLRRKGFHTLMLFDSILDFSTSIQYSHQ
jgi:hypothetical protein